MKLIFYHSPVNPESMDWSRFFPAHYPSHDEPEDGEDATAQTQTSTNRKPCVEFADIGCGYGGLLGMFDVINSLVFAIFCLSSKN